MTAVTVFVIAVAYNQVIELFPNGGGGYKVASSLLGSHAGLVSGSALDRRLRAHHLDFGGERRRRAVFPASGGLWQRQTRHRSALTLLLLYLNMRGMKESIRFLLPIFIGSS